MCLRWCRAWSGACSEFWATRSEATIDHGSEQREAAKRARIEIAKATDLEERTIGTEPTVKQVETVHDLWQAFGWSQATISRNGPYIGGHLAFYFKLNFKQVYDVL